MKMLRNKSQILFIGLQIDTTSITGAYQVSLKIIQVQRTSKGREEAGERRRELETIAKAMLLFSQTHVTCIPSLNDPDDDECHEFCRGTYHCP
jgi:hypothetical protein